jgi:exoribonuclease R
MTQNESLVNIIILYIITRDSYILSDLEYDFDEHFAPYFEKANFNLFLIDDFDIEDFPVESMLEKALVVYEKILDNSLKLDFTKINQDLKVDEKGVAYTQYGKTYLYLFEKTLKLVPVKKSPLLDLKITLLEKDLAILIQEEAYEKAAKLKDQIEKLRIN